MSELSRDEERETTSPAMPRRVVLRALTGLAVGGVTLVGLSACGGEDDDDDDDD